ncbi:MAG TPA: ParA family protein [Acidimicrobiales bacterium]|jgi:chromosome partitioning protein|nr:ParA family protein [Acidimicrobiales bacterium]
MSIVVAGLKGGVGKTTTTLYIAALLGQRRPVVVIDADPQASAAEWLETRPVSGVTLVEAPTERLLKRALHRSEGEVIVDTPPGSQRLAETALSSAEVVIVPTRVGGVEVGRVQAAWSILPKGLPAGLVVCSARPYTRDHRDTVAAWEEVGFPIWGTIPERVGIAAGPDADLHPDGLEAYRAVWDRVRRARRTARR